MKPRSLASLQAQFPTYAELRRRDQRQLQFNRIVHTTFYAAIFVWSVWAGLVLEVARNV